MRGGARAIDIHVRLHNIEKGLGLHVQISRVASTHSDDETRLVGSNHLKNEMVPSLEPSRGQLELTDRIGLERIHPLRQGRRQNDW